MGGRSRLARPPSPCAVLRQCCPPPTHTRSSDGCSLQITHPYRTCTSCDRRKWPLPLFAPTHPQGISVLEICLDPLTNRTGDQWHICVHGLRDLESLCWAWRADGEVLWQSEWAGGFQGEAGTPREANKDEG